MRIELLWFEGCPNHEVAEELLREVLDDLDAEATVVRVEVPDEETGNRVCFPGSPTIRVDGTDIEPGWEPCEDCTPPLPGVSDAGGASRPAAAGLDRRGGRRGGGRLRPGGDHRDGGPRRTGCAAPFDSLRSLRTGFDCGHLRAPTKAWREIIAMGRP